MRKTLGVSLLVLLLTCSAFAGEMPNGSPEPPPPPPQMVGAAREPTNIMTLAGEVPNGVADSITQTALEVLVALPSLFY